MALFGLSGAVFGQSATRDFDAGSFPILLTSGVVEAEYVVGRLAAAVIVAILVSLAIVVGLLAGLALPPIRPEHVAPLDWQTYTTPVLIYVIPNCIIIGTLLFTVGLLGRRTLWVYVALPVAIVLVGLAATASSSLIGTSSASLLGNPLGPLPPDLGSWTPVQKNTQTFPITSEMLVNRVVWLAVALAGASILARQFHYTDAAFKLPGMGWHRPASSPTTPSTTDPDGISAGATTALPPVAQAHSGVATCLVQLGATTRFEVGRSGRDWLFWVLALGGIVFFVTSAGQGDPLNFGVAVWPVTSHMLAATGLFA
ncbi:MAG: hypothetical protein JOZ87_34765, partial [Chloroflexi bacterium]|nr:hypothetical protein [Chloroflexota bacterium]